MSFLLSKLGARRIFSSLRPTSSILSGIGSSRVMAGKSIQEITLRKGETHDEKNLRLKRPCSPHLSIYRAQYTSMFSIIHRITGSAFSVILMSFTIFTLVYPYPFECAAVWVEEQELSPLVITLGKLILAIPFTYHACNGVRHLLWDWALFLSLNHVWLTGITMLGVVITCLAIEIFLLQ